MAVFKERLVSRRYEWNYGYLQGAVSSPRDIACVG